MELRQLRYFTVAAETENFNEAARRINVSQPALSRQIRALEEEMGVELFARKKKRVSLTYVGEWFYRDIRRLQDELERAVRSARSVSSGYTGTLRVGYSETANYGETLPLLIREFAEMYPSVALELTPSNSTSIMEQLLRREINVAFSYHVPADAAHLSRFVLNKEQVVLAVPIEHPLSKLEAVTSKDLASERFVFLPRKVSPTYYDAIIAACRKTDFTMNVVQEGASDAVMLSLVAANVGLTFTTTSASRWKPSLVKLVPIADMEVEVTLYCLWHDDDPSPSLSRFVDLITRLN